MKFQVPQFVEVEDKLFWRLTLKQFIYLAGGGGMTVVIFLLLPRLFAVFLSIPVIAFSLALAFYKVNNRPFIFFVESAFLYFFNDKLYIWRKEEKPISVEQPTVADTDASFIPKMNNSKLKDMNWSLDTKGQAPEEKIGEKNIPAA